MFWFINKIAAILFSSDHSFSFLSYGPDHLKLELFKIVANLDSLFIDNFFVFK